MPGSRVCFYGLDALHEGRPIILVEGELDVATLLQEADTLVAPLGTGGTAGVRHPEWVTRLQRQAAPVLVAFDHDAGQGDAAARYWLEALGARAWRWRPIGKDVNEMLQQGQDLRAWVETGVRLAQTACLHQREEARPAPGEEKQAGTRVAEEPNPEARLTPDSPAGALQPGLRSGAPTEPTERKPAMEAIPTPEPERCHCCRAEAEWSDPYDRPCCGAHVLPWDLTPLVEQGVFTRLEAAGSWEPLVRFVLEASCAGTGTYSEEETERNAFVALQLYELQLQIQAGASLGIDCETTGLSPRRDRLITVTFGQPGRIFLLDLRPFWTWPDPEQARWKREIQTLFVLLAQAAAPQHPLTWVGHNLKFDLQFLAEQLGVLLIPRGTSNTTVRPHDTMLVEQVLQNGRASGSVSLEAVASRYGLAVSKAERPWFVGLDQRPAWREPLPEDQQRYLVQDVLLPLEIMARQLPQIRQERVERVVELEMEALPAVAEMERHGVCIDQESWQACSRAVQEELARQEVELTRSLGEVWSRWQASQPPRIPVANPARVYQPALEALVPPSAPAPARADAFSLHSLEQVRVVLSVICGTPIEATREEALAPYADRPDVRHYLAWKKLQHFHTTFGEEFLRYVEADGRIHADFRQLGARSGRLICQRPNLQQLPRRPLLGTVVGEGDLRRCIVAPPGAKLVTADLSNIELRILAEVSQDAQLLAAFAAGKDVHSETARLVFGLPEGTDPRQERWGQSCLSLREIAKTINFGLIYGMGPASLAQRIGVSLEEARQLMRRFAAQYPRLDAWVRQASRQALRQGVSRSLGGRPRWFPEQERRTANRAALERAARNHPIQGTNADILKRALALLWQRLPPGVVVVLAVHDEIVLECPEDRVEEASQVLRETLRAACKDFLKTVEVPEPEVVVAPWWSKEGHPQGKETQ
ncbi:DNA polymerase [Thermogemmatispora sp.]|uniref:DNA polymerase n=1 Tax=Thermogemmatispora sp. TaxID=1968838 RepID=UPI0035E404C6